MKQLLSILMILFTVSSFAQDVQIGETTLTFRDVVTGVEVPWEMLWGPDDHLWVTERPGRVIRIDPETGNFNTILDWESEVESGGEPGMLGMALHPDFENTPLVYLVYNFSAGFSVRERLVSFEWDGENLVNETILLDDIPGGGIHNGARLLMSLDGKILMTTGDRGNADLSQDMSSLNGKLLRINLDGSIPEDNPDPESYIYSYGHRNAQGLCHGPNGIIYSSEHGAQQSDELNLIERNRNYGWPIVQGACNTNNEEAFCEANAVVEPLREWSPCVAVNDIVYYNHPAIPEFQNSVLMAVLGGLSGGAQRISQLVLNENGTAVEAENQYFTNFGRLRDICINPHTGAIYIATNGPQYPGFGPNRIVEYRNMDYIPTNTAQVEAKENLVSIYPNPTTEASQIQFDELFLGQTYEIHSFSGQLVVSSIIDRTLIPLPELNLPKGTYYVKANSAKGTVTKTFVVQ